MHRLWPRMTVLASSRSAAIRNSPSTSHGCSRRCRSTLWCGCWVSCSCVPLGVTGSRRCPHRHREFTSIASPALVGADEARSRGHLLDKVGLHGVTYALAVEVRDVVVTSEGDEDAVGQLASYGARPRIRGRGIPRGPDDHDRRCAAGCYGFWNPRRWCRPDRALRLAPCEEWSEDRRRRPID